VAVSLADAAQAIRARVEAGPLRRPPFNIAAVDEARALASRADRLHQEADAIVAPSRMVLGRDGIARVIYSESPEAQRVAALRRTACDLEARADALVPTEYR